MEQVVRWAVGAAFAVRDAVETCSESFGTCLRRSLGPRYEQLERRVRRFLNFWVERLTPIVMLIVDQVARACGFVAALPRQWGEWLRERTEAVAYEEFGKADEQQMEFMYTGCNRDHGDGAPLFHRGALSHDADNAEVVREVLYHVKDHLRDLKEHLPPDVELKEHPALDAESLEQTWEEKWDVDDAKRVLGGLYAALHYEEPIRSWASRHRRVSAGARHAESYGTPLFVRFLYWVRPPAIFFCCFATQSFLLHITTYVYLRYVEAVHRASRRDTLDVILRDITAMHPRIADPDGEIQKLIPLWLLDVSGAIPLLCFFSAYLYGCLRGCWSGKGSWWWSRGGEFRRATLGIWTKTFLIGAVMAILKGAVDLITVLPDSSGWKNCRRRMGDRDIKSLQELNFEKRPMTSMAMLLWLELGVLHHGPMRYCADMLISGHTYFALVFSLGSYHTLRHCTRRMGLVRVSAGIILILCVLTEVTLVCVAKFHYTVDMFLSLVLVLFLWDSQYTEACAREMTVGYCWRVTPNYKGFFSGFFWCGGYSNPREAWIMEAHHTQYWRPHLARRLEKYATLVDDRIRIKTIWGRELPFRLTVTCPRDPCCTEPVYREAPRLEFFIDPQDGDFPLQISRCEEVQPWVPNHLVDTGLLQRELLDGPIELGPNAAEILRCERKVVLGEFDDPDSWFIELPQYPEEGDFAEYRSYPILPEPPLM